MRISLITSYPKAIMVEFRMGNASMVGVVLAILVAVVTGVTLFTYLHGTVAKPGGSAVAPTSMHVEKIKILNSGGLAFYIANDGSTTLTVDEVMFIEPGTGKVLLSQKVKPVSIPPSNVGEVVVPAIYLIRVAQVGENAVVRLYGSSASGAQVMSIAPIIVDSKTIRKAVSVGAKAPKLAFLANTSSTVPDRTHWVVFDYVTGEYWLYSNYSVTNPPQLVEHGYAPILHGVNAYTITTSWVSFADRPVDSPIVIVINPTYAKRDWDFNWTDPHGTFTFHLEKLSGDVVVDFLIFWEDLYNPAYPQSLDDWKDHVVRVTQFANGTFRIAVYLAKGGYSHNFYIGISEPYSDIGTNTPLYVKPFGATWAQTDALGRYVVYDSKVWLVHVG